MPKVDARAKYAEAMREVRTQHALERGTLCTERPEDGLTTREIAGDPRHHNRIPAMRELSETVMRLWPMCDVIQQCVPGLPPLFGCKREFARRDAREGATAGGARALDLLRTAVNASNARGMRRKYFTARE